MNSQNHLPERVGLVRASLAVKTRPLTQAVLTAALRYELDGL
jgi:hypothetical protein